MNLEQNYQIALPLFNFIQADNQNLQEIESLPDQTSCQFYFTPTSSQINSNQEGTRYRVLLSIHGSWVVQKDPNTHRIVSLFQCDYWCNFVILRKANHDNYLERSPIGIKFIFRNYQNKVVELRIDQLNIALLYQFTNVLESKLIVQLDFFKNFKPIRKLGSGLTSVVYSALNLNDKKNYAIKSPKKVSARNVDNERTHDEAMINQFKIWNSLSHKNIVKLIGLYQSEHSTYMVTELLPLSLYSFVKNYGFPKRNVAKMIVKQLVQAVDYMHSIGIMHRDIKLQNIMIRKDEITQQISPVIIDFGLAENLKKEQFIFNRCGTPGYTAPEILSIPPGDKTKIYSEACDMFSLGVVAFIIFFKKFPFEAQNMTQIQHKNGEALIDFEQYKGKGEDNLVNLLQKMLQKDPVNRISAKQALQHTYFDEPNEQKFQNSKPTSISLTKIQ